MGSKEKIRNYIKTWESRGYDGGIPDKAPPVLEKNNLVPSYRMICITLMKNPNNLEALGFSREKCAIYQELKRLEISQRNVPNKQLNLFS